MPHEDLRVRPFRRAGNSGRGRHQESTPVRRSPTRVPESTQELNATAADAVELFARSRCRCSAGRSGRDRLSTARHVPNRVIRKWPAGSWAASANDEALDQRAGSRVLRGQSPVGPGIDLGRIRDRSLRAAQFWIWTGCHLVRRRNSTSKAQPRVWRPDPARSTACAPRAAASLPHSGGCRDRSARPRESGKRSGARPMAVC